MLSAEQIKNYECDGFLVLEKFAAATDCDRLRARAEDLVREFDPRGVVSIFSTHEQTRSSDEYFLDSGDKISFFFEEDAFDADGSLRQPKERSINKIGHALHDLDPVFNEFSRRTEIKELVSNLGIQRPLLLQSMYIFKQPNIGGEVTCHQDATFLYTEPLRMVGLWFALEEATVENGCLWAIAGGHKFGLKSRFVRVDRDALPSDHPTRAARAGTPVGRATAQSRTRFEVFDVSPWPEENLQRLEVEKGTLIVLHPLLPHLSRENRSPKSRHAYTLHIVDASSDYADDNWLQRSPDMPLHGF